jgi:hypothetical protein
MNPNILIRRIVKTNKIKLDIEEKISEKPLEVDIKIDRLEESTQYDIEKKIIII